MLKKMLTITGFINTCHNLYVPLISRIAILRPHQSRLLYCFLVIPFPRRPLLSPSAGKSKKQRLIIYAHENMLVHISTHRKQSWGAFNSLYSPVNTVLHLAKLSQQVNSLPHFLVTETYNPAITAGLKFDRRNHPSVKFCRVTSIQM